MRTSPVGAEPSVLPLTYLAFFVGLRANELIVQRGHTAGFTHFRESHGFVVQHLIDASRTITDLAMRMGVTQQAASKVIAEMTKLGIVEAMQADDRRAKQIRLTSEGWAGVRLARRSRREIDRRLSRTVGQRRYEAARAVLLECLNALGQVERVKARRVRQPL